VGTGRRSLLGAAVAFGTLLVVGWLAYQNTLDLIGTQRWIAHTHEVLDTLDETVSIMKDAEIAVRGYLVTADDQLARRRALARPALVNRLGHLRALVADNPEQEGNVEALDLAIRAKLAYSDDVVAQRRARDVGAAELSDRLGEGLRRIDEIEGLAARVAVTERELLAVRETEAAAGNRWTLVTVAGGTVVALALLATMLAVLTREVKQRRRVEERLRVSEGRLTLALDASQMGLWDLDLRTDESHRTLRHDQIFGYDTLQPAWGREVFLPHLYPDDREVEQRAFDRALATGEFDLECRIVRHGDRAIRWIATRGKLFRDAHGEPVRLMGSVMDVTERKEAEQRLHERTQQLEAANEALGSFTYSVSHDLRAPLRAIDGYAHILFEDHAEKLDADCRRVLDVIRSNARQMGRLIDDLLAFSRLGRTELDRTTTDVAGLARAVVDELRRIEPERQVVVTCHALPTAFADGSMLRHVLANLVGNAWKFTRGRAAAAIEIGSADAPRETIYWVKDNGAGFDMRYAGKLFRVFERLHRADEFEGTGVGLAIVQRVVQRHGGRVWAESEAGAGATFFFALPKEKGAHHGYERHRDPAGGGQPGGRGAGGTGAPEAQPRQPPAHRA
jgi:PAS domain S-box-containing protein